MQPLFGLEADGDHNDLDNRFYRAGSDSANNSAQDTVRRNLIRGKSEMFDSFVNQLVESALASRKSELEAMAKARTAELESIRSKVRTQPDEVEAWLDREIEKVSAMNISDLLRSARA